MLFEICRFLTIYKIFLKTFFYKLLEKTKIFSLDIYVRVQGGSVM